ncbi:4-alpha-glucanotransferase [Sphingomonas nostoxanthinifaciens]|uniref:4-alpha-glucanotransferase n=1 Tax=Sphingomonas nostoxanthinifaciens TaxID=2872652 RepID=UPI001CC1F2AF|nr:4-alpha-glucanotransferase [Sphingomonas nostoxanthinifaciens]UAK23309.1 4-alpha-glucanotransferase [Sphingomonas nostoxanthinifaciens]
MSDAAVTALAEAAGILIDWEDADSKPRRVSIESLRAVLSGLGLACGSAAQCAESAARLRADTADTSRIVDAGAPLTGLSGRGLLHLEDGTTRDLDLAAAPAIATAGYHRLEHAGGVLPLIVAPPRCAVLPADARAWGLAVQVYSLRGDGAFGDFRALGDFAGHAARAGADAVMLSPVHALFTADPSRYSPYSPSSRIYLNPWYATTSDAPAADGDLIDWPSAVHAKLAAFQRDYAAMRDDPGFATFRATADAGLRQHALFEALYAHFFAATGARGWQGWPEPYRTPASPAVAAFAQAHGDAIDFHLFLQWRAETDLGDAAAVASAMRIGLVADIAVGIDAGGSHAWARGDELMLGIGIGAPPDAFQAEGQNWGITSFSPFALRTRAYQPFIDLLRSAMRHSGGVRFDHALGLRRLWVVPSGASPLDGAYLRQPEADLLRLIALESTRANAIVIGEDLGVVPEGLRDTLAARGLLGMRVLPFERMPDRSFRPPAAWDRDAVAMTSTHDLPPVAGWWQAKDIDWRETLGAAGDRAKERAERADDRALLWRAFTDAGAATDPAPAADVPAPVVDAALAFVAGTPSTLAIVPVEDLLGLDEAPNLPGTIDEHPNWRRRLPDKAEALFARPDVARHTRTFRTERPA